MQSPIFLEIAHLHSLAPPARAGVQQVQVSPPSAARNDTI